MQIIIIFNPALTAYLFCPIEVSFAYHLAHFFNLKLNAKLQNSLPKRSDTLNWVYWSASMKRCACFKKMVLVLEIGWVFFFYFPMRTWTRFCYPRHFRCILSQVTSSGRKREGSRPLNRKNALIARQQTRPIKALTSDKGESDWAIRLRDEHWGRSRFHGPRNRVTRIETS